MADPVCVRRLTVCGGGEPAPKVMGASMSHKNTCPDGQNSNTSAIFDDSLRLVQLAQLLAKQTLLEFSNIEVQDQALGVVS